MKTGLPKSFVLAIPFAIVSLFFTTSVFSQATLTTDSADYQPGSTATLTGIGFQPGESVRVQVLHADHVPGDPITGDDHEPWWVTADANGEFVTTWHVCEDDCVGQLLRGTAEGETSALYAETLFTDATKTWIGANNGSWNTATNWNPAGVPVAGDDVIIPFSVANINVLTSASCNSITFVLSSGSAATTTLTLSSGATLAVNNGITVANDNDQNRTVTFTGAGAITCASLTVGGIVTALTANATTTLNSSLANLSVSGNVNLNGETDVVLFIFQVTNNPAFNITDGIVTVGGTTNTDEENGSNVTLNMNTGAQIGTLILQGATPFNNVNGTLTFNANGTNATVNYNRAGNQPIFTTTYRNLTLSGTGTKSLSGGITVNGTMTVTAGVVFAMGGNNVGNPNSVTLEAGAATGSLITGTGTLTLGGNVTVNDAAGAGTSGTSISTPIALNGATRTFTIADDGSPAADLTLTGAISGGANGITKAGAGTLVFADGTNTYTGITTINSGELRLNPSADVTPNTQMLLNGGDLSTTGIAASRTITDASTLRLTANSTIHLGSNVHTLRFANSTAVVWTGGTTLTIFGWEGTGGISGTAGKIFFDGSATSLTSVQLGQISFDGYTGTPVLLSSGELVPPPTTPILAITGTLDHGIRCVGAAAAPITYTITNTGTAASGVTVTSDDPQFVVSNLSSTNIPELNGTVTFQVTFTPNGLGTRSGTITVASTTEGSNSPTIGLTGTGTTPPVATFSYSPNQYCQALPSNPSPVPNPFPTFSGGGIAGIFTANSPQLVFVDASTGQVNLATSSPGLYTVTNTVTQNGCTTIATSSIRILALPTATISYSKSAFCTTDDAVYHVTISPSKPPFVDFTYTPNGPGHNLNLDEFTGDIVPLGSDPGVYTVKMVFIGVSCPNSTTTTVTIDAPAVATFSYAGSPYCQNGANPSPTFSGGGVAGTFTASSTNLVFVSTATGQINLAASQPGTYIVTNTITGGCPQVQASSSITITALPVAIFSYSGSPYCSNAANPTPAFSSGGVAGTFTALPAGLVFVSNTTGVINLSASAPGTYTVTNTIAAANGCGQVQANSTVTINTPPTVTQSTVSVCEGQSSSLSSAYTCPGGGTFTNGPRNAGTGASVNGPGTIPWTNPQLITSNDNNPATAALLSILNGNTTSDYLQGTNYGFNIPSTATIQGITVEISRHVSDIILGASINDQEVNLLKAGAIIGTNKALATDWPLAFTIQSYGGATDLWGTAWTPAQINATNFGASLSAINQGVLTNRTASVDFMRITVSYTLPNPTLTWYSVSSGGSPVATGPSFTPGNTLAGTYPYYVACSSVPDCRTQVDYVVKPTPIVDAIANVAYCNNEQVSGISFSSSTPGTATFNWTSSSDVGFGFGNTGNIGTFTANNPGTAPVTATVSVTATINGCTGLARTFTVTVNPTPTLTSSLAPPAICSNTAFTYTPTSATTGTTFNWSRAAVAGNPAASGTGNPNETLINTTGSSINATYVYSLTANGCTNPNTYNVVVTVNSAPAITTNPSDQLKCIGESASFTAAAIGSGVISYQWFRAGSPTPTQLTNVSGKISGATSATLTIYNIAVADAGDYYVVASGTCSPSATSSSAHLMVKQVQLSPTTAQYSDLVKFTARIYNGASLLTSNQTASVTFKMPIPTPASDLNVDGAANIALAVDGSTTNLIAEVTRPLVEVPANPSNGQMSPGNKTVKAFFNNITAPTSTCAASTGLTITKEDAWITYTGDIIKATASATTYTATLTLRANILDITVPQTPPDSKQDAYPGDIRNARVTFVNRDAGNAVIGSANLTPALVNSLDPKIGTASVPFIISGLSSSAPSQQIRIGIIVDNGYYVRNDPNDDIVVTAYIPAGDFITGGGYLVPTESVGSKASDDYKKGNFGFNVKFNKQGTNLQGSMNIIFRRTSSSDGLVHNYQVKANSMTSLGVDASKPNRQTAEFVSKVTLKDLNNSSSTDPDVGGNRTLYVKMIDNGEPGVNDSISFVIVSGNADPSILSNIIWSSNWVGNRTQQMNLTGGNLVVHSGFSLGGVGTTNYVTRDAYTEPADQPFALKAWPNPTEKYFNLHVTGNLSDNVIIKVYDISGKQVYLTSGSANHDYRFGDTFVTGVYTVEVRQGDKRSLLKVVKQ